MKCYASVHWKVKKLWEVLNLELFCGRQLAFMSWPQASVQTHTLWILMYWDFKSCSFLKLYLYSIHFNCSNNLFFSFFRTVCKSFISVLGGLALRRKFLWRSAQQKTCNNELLRFNHNLSLVHITPKNKLKTELYVYGQVYRLHGSVTRTELFENVDGKQLMRL